MKIMNPIVLDINYNIKVFKWIHLKNTCGASLKNTSGSQPGLATIDSLNCRIQCSYAGGSLGSANCRGQRLLATSAQLYSPLEYSCQLTYEC
jgi:hypothetical protein